MGYDFASISDIIVISIEVVHGVFEPTGAIFTGVSVFREWVRGMHNEL